MCMYVYTERSHMFSSFCRSDWQCAVSFWAGWWLPLATGYGCVSRKGRTVRNFKYRCQWPTRYSNWSYDLHSFTSCLDTEWSLNSDWLNLNPRLVQSRQSGVKSLLSWCTLGGFCIWNLPVELACSTAACSPSHCACNQPKMIYKSTMKSLPTYAARTADTLQKLIKAILLCDSNQSFMCCMSLLNCKTL